MKINFVLLSLSVILMSASLSGSVNAGTVPAPSASPSPKCGYNPNKDEQGVEGKDVCNGGYCEKGTECIYGIPAGGKAGDETCDCKPSKPKPKPKPKKK